MHHTRPPNFPAWLRNFSALAGPRFFALAECISVAVDKGVLRPGDRLPAQRDMARMLGLNVSTVTRAYAEVFSRGLSHAASGGGTVIVARKRQDGPQTLAMAQGAALVDLSHNFPATAPCQPAVERHAALSHLSESDMRRLSSIQTDLGLPQHREAGAAWLNRIGVQVSGMDTTITSGAQHGLLLAIGALTQAGDPIMTEELCFYGLRSAATTMGRRLVPVRMDRDGMMPDYLDAVCGRTGARILFCAPTLHNPTGSVMPLQRRLDILRVCERHGVTIVEDDVYRFMLKDAPPPFIALAPERTVYLTSISKIIGPAWRVGYLCAPPQLRHALGVALRATTLMSCTVSAEFVTRLIGSGGMAEAAAQTRAETRARQALVAEILNPRQALRHPLGFHVWLKLGPGWTEDGFVRAAEARGIAVTPGSLFEVGILVEDAAIRICVNAAQDRAVLETCLREIGALLGETRRKPAA